MDLIAVYITVKDIAQARSIGRTLVEERLAACINIFDGMQSIYRWDGAICEENETALIVKTQQSMLDTLVKRIKELHSYTCPCIVALPVIGGNNDYLTWIAAETGS